ncbi:efflux RND transporter periplasmic adaptor subunit [Phenylobacterium soli]|uniref:Efflux RND transporter periplasmic adaptor subunit n=1 Tax=Phenylobacterium soli TaxID=2170551 RepID=A0A328AE01_9CAUL|nr:efflux RND transporter periplasmic adaptor subunit [Phenylobacterium soli]RAK53073.1 efflux RND transporter periplasmic adaptor subunit [Phenylobacterium soli]
MSRRILLVSLAAALALAGCKKPQPAKAAPAEQSRAVSVVRVEPHAIQGALAASGDLTPREEAAVLPEVTGYRVASVLADVGQFVKKGQVLVRLDPTLIEAQIAQAQAQYEQAQDQANRVKGLDNQGVLSQEQIEQRRIQARVTAAQLRDLKTRYAKMNVTAPVSGLILEKTVRPGDLSAGGATPWFRLARDGEIELQAQLSEDDLAKIRPGQAAQVSLPSGAVVNGQVRLISPQVDPQTKLGFVRVRLPVRPDIRSGGFARAVFNDATGTAPAVPDTAVSYDADGASVMVVGDDNKLKRVAVQTGQRGGGWVQLMKGPPVGTRIVRAAGTLLLEGDTVKPVEGAQALAAPAAAGPRK